MRLRSIIRPPVRYIEYDIPELPGPPKFVHPTIPYDPSLPKAAFPTLDAPIPLRPGPPPEIEAPDTPHSALEPGDNSRQATVFRGPRNLPKDNTQKEDSFVSETGDTCSVSDSTASPPDREEALEEPGEFEAYGYFSEDEYGQKKPRVRLRFFKRLLSWSQLANGMKIIIMHELTQNRSFQDAAKLLALSEEQVNDFRDLHEREILREANEKENIDRCLARQLGMLMDGAAMARSQAYRNILEEELYDNIQDPATFIISKDDFIRARYFLRKSGKKDLIGLAEVIWQYYGVESFPLIASDLSSQNKQGYLSDEELEEEPQTLPINDKEWDINLEIQSSSKRQRRALLLNTLGPSSSMVPPVKRGHKYRAQVIQFKTPSSLRNSISAESPGRVDTALAPAALQPTQAPVTPKRSALHYRYGGPRRNESLRESQSPEAVPQFNLTATSPKSPATASATVFDLPPVSAAQLSTPLPTRMNNKTIGSDGTPWDNQIDLIEPKANPQAAFAKMPQMRDLSLAPWTFRSALPPVCLPTRQSTIPPAGPPTSLLTRGLAYGDEAANVFRAPRTEASPRILLRKTQSDVDRSHSGIPNAIKTLGTTCVNRAHNADNSNMTGRASPAQVPSDPALYNSDSEPLVKRLRTMKSAQDEKVPIANTAEAPTRQLRNRLSDCPQEATEAQTTASKEKNNSPVMTPARGAVTESSKRARTIDAGPTKTTDKSPEKVQKRDSIGSRTRTSGTRLMQKTYLGARLSQRTFSGSRLPQIRTVGRKVGLAEKSKTTIEVPKDESKAIVGASQGGSKATTLNERNKALAVAPTVESKARSLIEESRVMVVVSNTQIKVTTPKEKKRTMAVAPKEKSKETIIVTEKNEAATADPKEMAGYRLKRKHDPNDNLDA